MLDPPRKALVKIMNLLIVSTLLVISAASPVPDDVGWKIVGGSQAATGQFPYIISLKGSSGTHICGGSIVADEWVITAAHCVFGESPDNIAVVVGSNLINSGGMEHKVQNIITHKQYDPINITNDIALLHLSRPVTISSTVQIIPLETGDVGGGVDAVLAGWGSEFNGGSTPNALNYIDLQTITVSDCQSRQSPFPVYEIEVCTFTKDGEGACHGDSGGPLVANGNLIGIVSWGRPCGIGYPDVYTRVSSFSSWIKSIIA